MAHGQAPGPGAFSRRLLSPPGAQGTSAAVKTVDIALRFPPTPVSWSLRFFKEGPGLTTITFFTASITSQTHLREFC